MSAAAPQVFTASAIADALRCSPQAVRQHLESIPAQTQIVQGGPALAWPIAALPAAMQTDLEAKADARGFRSALHLLAQPAPAWQPKVSLTEAAPAAVEKAAKLQRALAPALARLDDPAPNAAASEVTGLDEFQKVFGYTITGRHWRRLLHRTLQRDAGARAWHRLELYLDGDAGRVAAASRASILARQLHAPFSDALDTLENKQHPTADDRAFLFHEAFTHFEALLVEHPDRHERRRLKMSLIEYLFSAVPALAKTAKSFRRIFEVKLHAWQDGGRALESLRDARSMKSGNFRRPDFTADEAKIRDLAILHNGSESLAHRLLRQRGELSLAFVQYYEFDPRRNKSYVPGAVRANITPEVEMCGPLHRGPWQAKMRGPYIPRDWSRRGPGGLVFSG